MLAMPASTTSVDRIGPVQSSTAGSGKRASRVPVPAREYSPATSAGPSGSVRSIERNDQRSAFTPSSAPATSRPHCGSR